MTSTNGKRTKLGNGDLMALINDGHTADDIAAATGYGAASIITRLNRMGYTHEGQPMAAQRQAPREPVVNWYAGDDESWRDQAACFTDGHDPEMWFAKDRSPLTKLAKRICGECPVRAKCLDMALRAEGTSGAQYRAGIVGGMTVDERVALGKSAAA